MKSQPDNHYKYFKQGVPNVQACHHRIRFGIIFVVFFHRKTFTFHFFVQTKKKKKKKIPKKKTEPCQEKQTTMHLTTFNRLWFDDDHHSTTDLMMMMIMILWSLFFTLIFHFEIFGDQIFERIFILKNSKIFFQISNKQRFGQQKKILLFVEFTFYLLLMTPVIYTCCLVTAIRLFCQKTNIIGENIFDLFHQNKKNQKLIDF